MKWAELDQSDDKFIVTEGFHNEGVPDGWLVVSRETGLFTWITEASGITVADAKGRLLKEIERRADRETA